MAQAVDERTAQKSYWLEHSSQPTVEAMMLDSKASEIDQLERPEVMQGVSISAARTSRCSVLVVYFALEATYIPIHHSRCSIASQRRVMASNIDQCLQQVMCIAYWRQPVHCA